MEEELKKRLSSIEPIEQRYMVLAQARLDKLTKPLGSLGQVEEIAKRYVAIVENLSPKADKKVIYTFAADHGVGIDHSDKHPPHPCLDKGFSTGRSFTEMTAWLQRYIDIGISSLFSSPAQCMNFRMGGASLSVPSFADNRIPPYNDTADSRVRCGFANAFTGEIQRTFHHFCLKFYH